MQEYPARTREATSCPDLHGHATALAGFSRDISTARRRLLDGDRPEPLPI
jgi:hypothetical protein